MNLSAADVNADGDINAIDYATLKSYSMHIIFHYQIKRVGEANKIFSTPYLC